MVIYREENDPQILYWGEYEEQSAELYQNRFVCDERWGKGLVGSTILEEMAASALQKDCHFCYIHAGKSPRDNQA